MSAGLAARAIDNLEHVRRLVPPRYAPSVVRRKVDRLWADPGYRAAQERQMRYLLEFTDRADEVPELARKFAEHTLLRTYRRWYPHALHHQEVRGVEWLTTKRDPDRPAILNFMHHNWYEGLFASLANVGAPITIFASPKVLGPETPAGLRQHIKVVRHGSVLVPATGGTDHIQSQLRPGGTYAIASDVPGHTEARFLGRRVLSSFGAPLIASRTNSPVVLVTNHRTADGQGSYIQVHEPLEPGDFAEPLDMLHEILRRHGEAVLAWPEVLEMPRARWGILEE